MGVSFFYLRHYFGYETGTEGKGGATTFIL